MSQRPASPRHSIQLVSRRTGLTPDVIRAWERRYGAVEPGRSETRRRLYSDEDVERLRLLRRATLAGRRIGEVARLPLAELAPLVEQDERASPAPTPAVSDAFARPLLDDCVAALRRMDGDFLEAILRRAAREMSPCAMLEDVLAPLMVTIGEGWRSGALGPHHEHLATPLVRSMLDILRTPQVQSVNGPAIVIATPPGQVHELGAMMAAVVAVSERWRVTYLGAELPAGNIAAAASALGARAVGLSLTYPPGDPAVTEQVLRLRGLLPPSIRIAVGGRATSSYAQALAVEGVDLAHDSRELGPLLARIHPAT